MHTCCTYDTEYHDCFRESIAEDNPDGDSDEQENEKDMLALFAANRKS